MVRIRVGKDASMLEPPTGKPRPPSPIVLVRAAESARLRAMIEKLTDREQAYEVILDPGEKAVTVRQRLYRVAAESGKKIVVRTYGKGFAVGLLTPERVTRRGRGTPATNAPE
jgi:hypothetical protein